MDKKIIWSVAVLVLAGLAFSYYGYNKESWQGGDNSQEVAWQTYENPEYGFRLEYPEGWGVAEFSDTFSGPMFNIYKLPLPEGVSLPLNHFSEATQVSLYPKGIPTEGVYGENRPTTFEFPEKLRQGFDYTLEDGTVWARYLNPEQYLPNWSQAGFIWAKTKVDNLKTVCIQDGEEVSENQCDLFEGNGMIVRSGKINQEDAKTVEKILESFAFTKEAIPVSLIEPREGAEVTSPLKISGEARGYWFFEASFPVILVNWDGLIIAQGIATAQDTWMTEEMVPFTAELTFENPVPTGAQDFMKNGTLILQRDNPSGLPEHDAAVEVPVRFGN